LSKKQGSVTVFPTCIVEYQQPSIGHDLVKVYERTPTDGEVSFLHDKIVSYSMDEKALYDYIKRLRYMELSDEKQLGFGGSRAPELGFGGSRATELGFGGSRAVDSSRGVGSMIAPQEYRGPGSQYKENQIFQIAEQVSKLLADQSKPAGYSQLLRSRNQDTVKGMTNQYKSGYQQEGDLLILPREVTGDWTVPEKHQPPCAPCPLKCRVNPMIDQTALIGTLLEDAADTQVGSILPKFEYNILRS
jgi:hypothetical protein